MSCSVSYKFMFSASDNLCLSFEIYVNLIDSRMELFLASFLPCAHFMPLDPRTCIVGLMTTEAFSPALL